MFEDIDRRRARAGISQAELCARAGVHPTSYTARKNGRTSMVEPTLQKLQAALVVLLAERREAINDVA